MRSTFRTFGSSILGIVSALATIAGFYFQWIQSTELTTPATVGVVFLGMFATYFFLAHLFTRATWERKGRYVEALERLNSGFEEIHDLNRHSEEATSAEIKKGFRVLCNHLAEALTYATTNQCFVCVKVLTVVDDETSVRTLCRDERSSRKRRRADANKSVDHPVDGNTGFKESVANQRGRFISNRLPILKGYKNTSHQLYADHPPDGPRGSLFVRYWKWKLPYKSTIVVPVTPPHGKDNFFSSHDDPDFVGFLCVDSPKMGVFKDDYDTEIMKGVADGMYNTLEALKGKLQVPHS